MEVPVNPLKRFSIPVYEWADAVLGGTRAGYPADIKCIYNVGGNLLVQGSDIRKNINIAFEYLVREGIGIDLSLFCHKYMIMHKKNFHPIPFTL